MTFLGVDGADIAFRVSGDGPPLVAPECNFTWAPAFEELMARRFTVIVPSPRDFGASTRTGGPYEPNLWASDLLAVARHLGYDRFLCFGYSFTGAFTPWLARRLASHNAVAAVASGGFPLLGDYAITSADVDAQLAELENDPVAMADWDARFDPRAGAAFYRDIARLAPDALVDEAPCPLYSFWGDQDTDAVEFVLTHDALRDGLRRRGVPWKTYAGYDHEGLNGNLEVAWPDVEAWLLERADDANL